MTDNNMITMKYSQDTLNEPCQKLISLNESLFELSEEIARTFSHNKRTGLPSNEVVLCHLYNRARQDYRSAYILCAEGLGNSSLILIRALFEHWINYRYIVAAENEKDHLSMRFLRYEWIDQKKGLEYWKLFGDNLQWKNKFLNMEPEITLKVEQFKKDFNTKDISSWAGKSVRDMAKGLGIEQDYLSIYRFCCGLSHPSLTGAKQSVFSNDGNNTLFFKSDSASLVANFQVLIEYFAHFVNAFNLTFKLGFNDRINCLKETAFRTFKETNSYLVF